MGAIAGVIGTFLLTKGLKLTMAITFLISSFLLMKIGILQALSGFALPDLVIPVWNYFRIGSCLDIILSAYLTLWLFSFRMILLKIMTD